MSRARGILALFVAGCASAFAAPEQCPTITPGRMLRAGVSSARAACVAVTIKSGEAAQLSVEQPVDLVLRVIGGAGQEADGFEFGNETLTISTPGSHLIEVRLVNAAGKSAWTISMSERVVSLQLAHNLEWAEDYATRSKRTGRAEDLAASLALWKEVGDQPSVARTHLKQGDSLLTGDDPSGARTAYETALQICSSLAELRCVAEAANNTGYTAFLQGDFEAASRRLTEAADHWRHLSLKLFEGQTLSNLGLLYWQSGDFERAIGALDAARRILNSRAPVPYAQVLNNIGLYYQSLSENDKALAYFQSALAIFVARHESRHAVRTRLNLGRSYMLLGNLSLAKLMLQEALADATKSSDLSAKADVLNNLGQVLLRLHQRDEARALLTEALALQRRFHSKRGEAIALHYLGLEARERGETELARRVLNEAAEIRRDVGLRDDASESVFALAELEYGAGNTSASHDLTNQAVDLIESLRSKVPSPTLRATYYGRKRRFFDLLVETSMAANPSEGTDGLLSAEQARGRSLLDLVTSGGIGGAVPKDLLGRRSNLRSRIAVSSARMAEADPTPSNEASRQLQQRRHDDLRRQLELLLSEEDELEGDIRRAVNASSLGHPLSSLAELQAGLPNDSAVLEYYLGENVSYLWVVQPHSLRSFRLPPRSAVEALASRMIRGFGSILERRRSTTAQDTFEADLRRLSAVLLGPLSGAQLPPRLIFVLDGVLNRVPMSALRVPGARQPLGLGFDLIQVPSSAYLLAAMPPRPFRMFPRTALAVADPVFGPDDPRVAPVAVTRSATLPRLPFTDDIAALRSLVPPDSIRVLQGFDATPATLRSVRLGDFAILHFSTHTLIDDRIPELSRVALSLVDRTGGPIQGYLRPDQFVDFRLNGSIVVLSSCETALGRVVLGEGIIGFADSLFSAGASQLVLAVTKVDAESAAAFFAEAYRHLLGGNSGGLEKALTEARRALARSNRWADPFYWAPFVAIGMPSEAK